jgi:hypothetical protein
LGRPDRLIYKPADQSKNDSPEQVQTDVHGQATLTQVADSATTAVSRAFGWKGFPSREANHISVAVETRL